MTKTIYLAGLISTTHPASLEWRHEAERRMFEHCKVLSPLRGHEDLAGYTTDGGVTHPRLTSKDILLRDWRDVRNSDVILVSLDDYDSPRPMIGTMFELAWAWEHHIPVVGFSATPLMKSHPFVVEAVAKYCADLDEAISALVQHYLR